VLEELHVRDLALIEEVWLEFAPGLTVLTGETGAGKTALVGAIKLLIGERADSTLVRAGAPGLLVEGRLVNDGDERIVRRTVSADGRSKCTLDGAMAAVGELAEGIGPLFDLHGQHEHQALLMPSRHADYLDRYIGKAATEAHERYALAFAQHTSARSAIEELQRELSEVAEKSDYMRFVVEEIDSAAISQDEDAELERRLPALRHGERLTAAAAEAFDFLRGEGGAGDAVARALASLERVVGLDPALDQIAEALAEADRAVQTAGTDLREYAQSIDHDPATLNEIEARLAALATLKKKYGPELADVMDTRVRYAHGLEAVDAGEERMRQAEDALERSAEQLRVAGEALVEVRTGAVEGFTAALGEAVEDLAMSGAHFGVSMTHLDFEAWTSEGPHRVEFLFAPAKDQALRPLAKIASGGEVSRVMLALKSVLGAADRVPVLVFDEVDAGIGGTAAVAVGRRLADLARVHQVLVVTHLAQVAAYAQRHLVVEKEITGGSTTTTVRHVEGADRVAEIARMLSGADTKTGRAHAEELLAAVHA